MPFRFFDKIDTLNGSGYPYGEPREVPPISALLDEDSVEDLDLECVSAEGAD